MEKADSLKIDINNIYHLSYLGSNKVIVKDIINNFSNLLLKKIKRNKTHVEQEYNMGYWKEILEERPWEKSKTIQEYVFLTDQHHRIAKLNNKLVNISNKDYYSFRAETVKDTLIRFAGEEDDLVELGCGWGLMLFTMSLYNHWKNLIGFDISPNAIQATSEAIKYFGLKNMKLDLLNLLDPKHKNFSLLRNKVVFTHYCLEQLKYFTDVTIENIRNAGVKRVIHFEPTIELLRFWSLMDVNNYLYIKYRDYQDNLINTLKKFEKKGLVRIIECKRLYIAPTCRHDFTLVCWEPINK